MVKSIITILDSRFIEEKKDFHFLYCLVSYLLIGINVSNEARNCSDLDNIPTICISIRQQKFKGIKRATI